QRARVARDAGDGLRPTGRRGPGARAAPQSRSTHDDPHPPGRSIHPLADRQAAGGDLRGGERRGRSAMTRVPPRLVLAVVVVALCCAGGVRAQSPRPALLVLSPQGTANGWVDLDYLDDLHRAGFEVDYTDSLAEVTWDRLRQYNALVLYTCPPDDGAAVWPFTGKLPISKAAYIGLIERYLAAGGGVLIMAVETQIRATLTRPILAHWGADLPLERIEDSANLAYMTRMPRIPLIYTDQ